MRGKTVFAAGDSLIRDMWTALVVWLLVLDGIDVVFEAGAHHHAACMACAWKFLEFLGVEQRLKARGILVEGPSNTRVITVCGGGTRIVFSSAPRFSDLNAEENAITSGFGTLDLFFIGAGVHEMVSAGDDESAVREWARAVASLARRGIARHTVIVGTHARIIELAPQQYRGYAEGPQGNAKIRSWNAAIKAELGDDHSIEWVDPYAITVNLDKTYEDSEDGMHMGFWVNLQKIQLLLNQIS
jgi:hypothetical protein